MTGYSDVRVTNKNIAIDRKKMSYALLPVWLLTTRWKDQTYLFAMNGQTGKMVGDLPVDKRKKTILYWGSFAAILLTLSFSVAGQIGRLLFSVLQAFFS